MTITPAMIEAAARAICFREEYSERNWPKYVYHAEMALAAAFAVATDVMKGSSQ